MKLASTHMQKNTWLTDLFWLTLYIAILFGFMIGVRALSVPDEARYTEIPREMLWLHDFITPHLDGIKYFEKPPLLYWIQAGIIHVFGINEWALRAPTAIMGLLGCVSVYAATRFLYDRLTAIAAALILATSPLYFVMAHSITLDMIVSLWLTISLLAFICAVYVQNERKKSCLYLMMYVAMGLAVLSKGLIGLLLPALIIGSWIALTNNWRLIPKMHIFLGLVVFLIIVLPWHIAIQLKNPEFFHFYFIDQQFLRYATKSADRYQPFWWFLPILIGGFFPWVIFAGIALLKKTPDLFTLNPKYLFFALWAVEIFIFFSLSKSKLIPYILPVLPPLAVLLAAVLKNRADALLTKKSCLILATVWFVLGVGFWIASLASHQFPYLALANIRGLAFIWIIGGIGLYVMGEQDEAVGLRFIWIVLMQGIWLWGVVITTPQFDQRPIKALALHLKQVALPTDIVASYGLYYQDLPVYLGRPVLIINWKNELTFGSQHQADAKNILLTQEAFWPIWDGEKRAFAVIDQSDFDQQHKKHPMHVLARQNEDLLVENH